MLVIAQDWVCSWEQNRHSVCSHNTESLMEKSENKQIHVSNECYKEKCPLQSSCDQGMDGQIRKASLRKQCLTYLKYERNSGEESCQEMLHKCERPKHQNSYLEIGIRQRWPGYRKTEGREKMLGTQRGIRATRTVVSNLNCHKAAKYNLR